jgi:hypothetical protein
MMRRCNFCCEATLPRGVSAARAGAIADSAMAAAIAGRKILIDLSIFSSFLVAQFRRRRSIAHASAFAIDQRSRIRAMRGVYVSGRDAEGRCL